MKKIATFLTSLVLILSVGLVAKATLWDYYNGNLPSISERAELAAEYGIVNYTGTAEQNEALETMLRGESLGIAIPTVVALFETSLQNSISDSATTMTLVSATTKSGTTLNGTYGFIINEGSTNEEFVVATCVSTSCTSMLRGIDVIDGETEVSALKKTHRRGESVKITNFPQLAILSRILNGQEAIPNLLTYENLDDCASAGNTSTAVVCKAYWDNLAQQGAATSTESVSGISRLATQIQSASSTDAEVNDPLVQQAKHATSTPSALRGLYDIWAENDGYLSQLWIDLTESFSFTGGLTANRATSTELVIGSTVPTNELGTGDLFVGGNLEVVGGLNANIEYYGDGQDGAVDGTGATELTPTHTSLDGAAASGQTTVPITATTGISAGDKVLIHQTQGTGVGNWEIGTVATVNSGVSLVMRDNLRYSYAATGAQAVLVPEYTSVQLRDSASLTQDDWDGTSGGITIFYASQGVFIETGVAISANSEGFRGGAKNSTTDSGGFQGEGVDGVGSVATTANEDGGGGGTTGGANDGAGGGGFLVGETADTGTAVGGAAYLDAFDNVVLLGNQQWKLKLGGGGGGGNDSTGTNGTAGGDGGGIIVVIAPFIMVDGTITSAGGNSSNGTGDGGGGGGGTIALFSKQIYGASNVTATGGTGGSNDAGGNGLVISGYPIGALPRY